MLTLVLVCPFRTSFGGSLAPSLILCAIVHTSSPGGEPAYQGSSFRAIHCNLSTEAVPEAIH